jgi:single-stranded DNA-binding protein
MHITIVAGNVRGEIKNIGRDGVAFSIPVTERWTNKASGEVNKRTEWYNLTANGRTAELVKEYVNTGDWVTVQCRKRTTEVNGKTYTNFTADRVQFGPRPSPSDAGSEDSSGAGFPSDTPF